MGKEKEFGEGIGHALEPIQKSTVPTNKRKKNTIEKENRQVKLRLFMNCRL